MSQLQTCLSSEFNFFSTINRRKINTHAECVGERVEKTCKSRVGGELLYHFYKLFDLNARSICVLL